jgi:hypothetical protein
MFMRETPGCLARIIHEDSAAIAHLRTLTGEIDLPLVDVGSTTPARPNAKFSCQSMNLHHLATDLHE